MKLAGVATDHGGTILTIADRAPGGVTVALVVATEPDAAVLERAADRDIPTVVVDRAPGEDHEAHERHIVETIEDDEVDLICLGEGVRPRTDVFGAAGTPTLAVHPSLLPAFPDPDPHAAVLDAGVTVSGSTVHVVDGSDAPGPIVTQEPVPVYGDDDAGTLERRVRTAGQSAAYPRAIRLFAADRVKVDHSTGVVTVEGDADGLFPHRRLRSDDLVETLRYGENPHQEAALYAGPAADAASVVRAPQRNEGAKALSYNNYNDADAALELVAEFDEPAAAVIKHTNPAGCATAGSPADAYARALATDPMSAFGGIVALNRPCDEATADQIIDSFKEVVVAPAFTAAALDVLRTKDDLRVLETGPVDERSDHPAEKPLVGGRLVQERDRQSVTAADLEVVTAREPTDDQVATMEFAWRTIKHVKSNAILFATGTETVGIGMGQVSRVDAVRLAAMKADEHAEGKSAAGAVMASDAFFPFPDGIEEAAAAGIEAVVQPGGSVNDDEVIAAADDHDMAMAFTGQRAFRHD